MEGGWVGGDSWFGSVMSCVELYKRLGLHSTFVVKGNTLLFPMKAMYHVLKARHGPHRAGQWVVFRSTIAEVPIFAVAYAWSKRGVSYFVSMCGRTVPSEFKYLSHFEDDYGNTACKEIDRPEIAHFLYDFLPLVDEHNKQRQNLLGLERCWLTKDVWFRLVTTLLGMSVVDMHRWHRNKLSNVAASTAIRNANLRFEEGFADELRIRQFANRLCSDLKNMRRVRHTRNPHPEGEEVLVRITNAAGQTTRLPTNRQINKEGRGVGTAVSLNCFLCRKYRDIDDKTVYRKTIWQCATCRMPLCKVAHGMRATCHAEHVASTDADVGCYGVFIEGKPFPKEKQVTYEHLLAQRPETAAATTATNDSTAGQEGVGQQADV